VRLFFGLVWGRGKLGRSLWSQQPCLPQKAMLSSPSSPVSGQHTHPHPKGKVQRTAGPESSQLPLNLPCQGCSWGFQHVVGALQTTYGS
jgi:hypothetical protein